MNKKAKAAAIVLAATFACGALAGCEALTTKDLNKDYAQIVAEIDITSSDAFEKEGLDKGFTDATEITKRELVMSFISNYSYLANYGYGYEDIFKMISESLVSQQVQVQYAKAYLAKAGKADGSVADYTALKNATTYKSEAEKTVKLLAFFLDDDEQAKAEYDLRVSVNGTLDNYELDVINAEEIHDHTPDSEVRTLPTGAEKEDADYFASVEKYRIYTGAASSLSEEYEAQDGSTPATRKSAYSQYVSDLRTNDFIKKGEDTSDFEKTSYWYTQLKAAYERSILDKLNDLFEEEYLATIDKDWASEIFEGTVYTQTQEFKDLAAFENAFNNMSESSFIFTAPTTTDPDSGEEVYLNYGYVINILLPFSTSQSLELSSSTNDYGDLQGNNFVARAQLLNKIRATDQRGSWFTGHNDYSYEGTGYKGTLGNDADRTHLFFENSFSEGKYELMKNYLGEYTYNGKVEVEHDEENNHTEYTLTPEKITIDQFIDELEGYLGHAGLSLTNKKIDNRDTYYTKAVADYYEKGDLTGDVDYSAFLYYQNKVDLGAINANEMFLPGTNVNKAFSVINELSFAYNTDTAGLNSYLGYMISPFKTQWVPEFEYAAQRAVAGGAGTYNIIPSDYGWHIIYCTFSFADFSPENPPFKFDYAAREAEDTFSYSYFELLKANMVSTNQSARLNDIRLNYYESCTTVHEDRYEDLLKLGV